MKSVYESRNKIMASGCSWTEESQLDHKRDYRPHWPSILSEKLNKEYSNYGRSGAGNQDIYNQVVDNYNNEDLICVLWSGFDRWDFAGKNTISSTNRHPKKVWDALTEANFMEPSFNLKRSFRCIHAFQNFCEANNIKYIHAIAFEDKSTMTSNRHRYLSEFIDDKIHDYINEDHFIGWPCFRELIGYTMSNHLNKVSSSYLPKGSADDLEPAAFLARNKEANDMFRVSSTDWHPNKKGHGIIADLFYDRYVKLYGDAS